MDTVANPDLNTELSPGVSAVTRCRVCGGSELSDVLDLQDQCIGNAFRKPGADTPLEAPLKLTRCVDCSFVQLAHSVDCDLMYSRYWYRSGVNQTMRDHLAGIATQATELAELETGDLVIDIGCNDGTTLQAFPADVRKIGVDPSNILTPGCDLRIYDYFSHEVVAPALRDQKASVITSIAMFYDLDRPREFVADIERCLADDGIWIAEISYLPAMLAATSYDTICHEHVGYYRLRTFEKVLSDSDLEVFDVEFNDSNGGSFRLFVAPIGTRERTQRYLEARVEESRMLLDTDVPYDAFCRRVERSAAQLRRFLMEARDEGKSVYGYGASTKGMVTLQYCGIDASLITAIAERNTRKFGLLTPGSDIPILTEDEVRNAVPDYLLVLPWHFLDEFLDRERDYLAAGGKIVVPLPEFKVYSKEDV